MPENGSSVACDLDVAPIHVRVADFAVARGEAVIATNGLGSCVAILLHDAAARAGGLAHVLLPAESMSRDAANRAKFPGSAVPLLIDEMRKLGARGPYTAKLVGGASMFNALLPVGGVNIGERNVEAARRALNASHVALVATDVGGDHGRSVRFHVRDGRAVVTTLRRGERVL